LLPPTAELEGCHIGYFPDTVFFTEDGKPEFIAKTDKEGKMIKITQPAKLSHEKIRISFKKEVDLRKRVPVKPRPS